MISPTHAALVPTQLFESEAETEPVLPPAAAAAEEDAAAVLTCLPSWPWLEVVVGTYEVAGVVGTLEVVGTIEVVATYVVVGTYELVDGDGAWTGALGDTEASVVVLVTVEKTLETDADALVTTGATLALGVVGTGAKFPPWATVDKGVPFSSTHKVTGTSTVTQAVSVTISGDCCRALMRGLALTIAARAAQAMVLLIGAIVQLNCTGLWQDWYEGCEG